MKSRHQSGNVIFFILVFIALFAALSYAVTQSMRGGEEGTDNQKATLAATEIMTYSNSIANAVATLKVNGCTDTQITFEGNNGISMNQANTAYTYTNSNAPIDKSCHVFDMNGGGVTPGLLSKSAAVDISKVPVGWVHSQSWLVLPMRITGNATDAGVGGTDLVLQLGELSKQTCMAINDKLGISNPGGNPPIDSWDCNTTAFTGSYSSCSNPIGDTVTALAGQKAFCVGYQADGPFNFMKLLIAR